MTKYFFLGLALTCSTAWTAAFAQAWDDSESAGFAGAQKRNTFKTDPQAEWADQYYVDPEYIIPQATGTGELAHRSVNRAAIRSGGYSFGFGPGASFPNPFGAGVGPLPPPPQQVMGPQPGSPPTNPGQPILFPGGQMPLYSGPNPSDFPSAN